MWRLRDRTNWVGIKDGGGGGGDATLAGYIAGDGWLDRRQSVQRRAVAVVQGRVLAGWDEVPIREVCHVPCHTVWCHAVTCSMRWPRGGLVGVRPYLLTLIRYVLVHHFVLLFFSALEIMTCH